MRLTPTSQVRWRNRHSVKSWDRFFVAGKHESIADIATTSINRKLVTVVVRIVFMRPGMVAGQFSQCMVFQVVYTTMSEIAFNIFNLACYLPLSICGTGNRRLFSMVT